MLPGRQRGSFGAIWFLAALEENHRLEDGDVSEPGPAAPVSPVPPTSPRGRGSCTERPRLSRSVRFLPALLPEFAHLQLCSEFPAFPAQGISPLNHFLPLNHQAGLQQNPDRGTAAPSGIYINRALKTPNT